MEQPGIFRKLSLERAASPDQLDRVLRITRPRGWVALSGLTLLVLFAMTWSVTGSIPVKVRAQGILLKSGGIFDVPAVTGGRIVDLAVSVGDTVHEGQVVARIAQPELAERILETKTTLTNLRLQQQRVSASGAQETSLQFAYLDEQQRGLEASIASAQQSVKWLDEKIATQQQLVDQGRLTRQTLVDSLQRRDTLLEKIRANANELAQIRVRRLQIQVEQQNDTTSIATRVDEAQGQLAMLERQLSAASEVVSPYTGRIIEILTDQGTIVNRAEPLMRLDLTGRTIKELEAVVYIASQDGKRIKLGMMVYLAPSTVRPEEYGYILGRVTYVSDFPITSKGMLRVLKNDALVKSLAGGDPPYEVHADLLLDAETFSSYRWSSSKGPQMRILSGTLCVAEIAVETRRPIEMMIPIARSEGR